MNKNILKEIIIILLICLAIILLIGILLYEYVPMKKTIPNPVSYSTPDNVKQELAKTTSLDQNEVIMTYEVESNDLNNYKKIQDYKPGKENPFSSYETTQTNTTAQNGTTGENANSATTSQNNNSKNNTISGGTTNTIEGSQENTTTSGGQFFQDKGTK